MKEMLLIIVLRGLTVLVFRVESRLSGPLSVVYVHDSHKSLFMGVLL